MAMVAAECFRRQNLGGIQAELLVINTGMPLGFTDSNIREFVVSQPPGVNLGDLRNFALSLSQAKWIIQWDDDDWHHEDRCNVQLQRGEGDAIDCVLLGSQVRYCLLTQDGFVHTKRRGIYGTILHRNLPNLRYPSKGRGEDAEFVKLFRSRSVIRGQPELYCRFHHGSNTWRRNHIMKRRTRSTPVGDRLSVLLSSIILPLYR